MRRECGTETKLKIDSRGVVGRVMRWRFDACLGLRSSAQSVRGQAHRNDDDRGGKETETQKMKPLSRDGAQNIKLIEEGKTSAKARGREAPGGMSHSVRQITAVAARTEMRCEALVTDENNNKTRLLYY